MNLLKKEFKFLEICKNLTKLDESIYIERFSLASWRVKQSHKSRHGAIIVRIFNFSLVAFISSREQQLWHRSHHNVATYRDLYFCDIYRPRFIYHLLHNSSPLLLIIFCSPRLIQIDLVNTHTDSPIFKKKNLHHFTPFIDDTETMWRV